MPPAQKTFRPYEPDQLLLLAPDLGLTRFDGHVC
jgi:hypothetical protein